MARRGPGDWDMPPRPYRPDRQAGFAFETVEAARAQDRKRARLIEASKKARRRQFQRLAEKLRDATSHPVSMASARYVRKRRLRINGQLVYLIARSKADVELVTLLPRGWSVPAKELSSVEPKRLMEQLRAALYRAGASKMDGWAILVLDIEYVEHTDAYLFHAHGIATGDLTTCLDELRNRPKFKARPDDGEGMRPVQLKRIAKGSEARSINYLIKSYFAKRVYAQVNENLIRTGKKVALPSHREVELLLWLNRWKIDDFVLSVHLYYGRYGLKVSRRGVH